MANYTKFEIKKKLYEISDKLRELADKYAEGRPVDSKEVTKCVLETKTMCQVLTGEWDRSAEPLESFPRRPTWTS